VCAVETAAHPCPINFPFTFKEAEWKAADQGWGLIQYNEDMGTMHNGAQLQFAASCWRANLTDKAKGGLAVW